MSTERKVCDARCPVSTARCERPKRHKGAHKGQGRHVLVQWPSDAEQAAYEATHPREDSE